MKIFLSFCLAALVAGFTSAGCTITIKPLAKKKKAVTHTHAAHHRRRAIMVEAEPELPAMSPEEPLRNLHRDRKYKLISPTPNPEYEP